MLQSWRRACVPGAGVSREEAQGSLWPTGPRHDEIAQPPASEEFDRRCSTIEFAE